MYRICFIDDDEKFEIPLFHRAFDEIFDVITANDYASLKLKIDNQEAWRPDLFVLDLYFPSEPASQGAIEALNGGVGRIVIADGRRSQPLRRALEGEGTVIEPA